MNKCINKRDLPVGTLTIRFFHGLDRYLTDTKIYNFVHPEIYDTWDRLLAYGNEEATTENVNAVASIIAKATKRPVAEVAREILQEATIECFDQSGALVFVV